MATRLYFHDTVDNTGGMPITDISSLVRNNYIDDYTHSHTMDTTIGTSQFPISDTWSSEFLNSWYICRFASPVLAVTSVAANTWSLSFACKESTLNANFPVNGANQPVFVGCFIWDTTTATKFGTILDGATASNVSQETTANTERAYFTTFTGAQVTTIPPGSKILLEVWFKIDQDTATTETDTFYFNGTTVNTTPLATVTSHASFLETPENLTFATTNTRSISEAAVTAGTGPPTRTLVKTGTMNEVIA